MECTTHFALSFQRTRLGERGPDAKNPQVTTGLSPDCMPNAKGRVPAVLLDPRQNATTKDVNVPIFDVSNSLFIRHY